MLPKNEYFITPESTIAEAMESLDSVFGLGLVVVDKEKTLLGTLTDGDIRRALIRGGDLNDSIENIYHKSPKAVPQGTSIEQLEAMTFNNQYKVIPIIDDEKHVVDVFNIDTTDIKNVSVVIMAGGLGSRLGEHTKDCPKPMLQVGGKPVLERIIENFIKVGFEKFYISVNYKAEKIEDYFKDGSDFNCEITYLREDKRLGTAGSLSLLPTDIEGPLIITNGDLLTLVDFRMLISFHEQHKSPITMCTRKFDFQVPFGVVKIENGQAQSIDEKPTHSFNVSAGVYVINKELLSHIPQDEFYDMPTLIEDLMKEGIKADCFPLVEQWIDIGKTDDLDYARKLYKEKND